MRLVTCVWVWAFVAGFVLSVVDTQEVEPLDPRDVPSEESVDFQKKACALVTQGIQTRSHRQLLYREKILSTLMKRLTMTMETTGCTANSGVDINCPRPNDYDTSISLDAQIEQARSLKERAKQAVQDLDAKGIVVPGLTIKAQKGSTLQKAAKRKAEAAAFSVAQPHELGESTDPEESQAELEHGAIVVRSKAGSSLHKAASTSAHAKEGSSLHKSTLTSVHAKQGSSLHKSTLTSVHAKHGSSLHKSTLTSVHAKHGSSLHKEAMTSVHAKHGSSLHKEAMTSVHAKHGSSLHKEAMTSVHAKFPSSLWTAAAPGVYAMAGSSLHKEAMTSVHAKAGSSLHLATATSVHAKEGSSLHRDAMTRVRAVAGSSLHKRSIENEVRVVSTNGVEMQVCRDASVVGLVQSQKKFDDEEIQLISEVVKRAEVAIHKKDCCDLTMAAAYVSSHRPSKQQVEASVNYFQEPEEKAALIKMVVQMAENKIHGDPSAQQRQAAQKYEQALKSLPLQKLKAVAANAKRDALRGIAGEIAKRREAYEEFEKEISKLEKNTRNAVHSAMQHKGTRVDAAHGVAYKRLPMSLLKQVSGDTIKKLQDSISSRDKPTKAILAKELASRKESQNQRFNDYIKSRVVPVAQKANSSHTSITNI